MRQDVPTGWAAAVSGGTPRLLTVSGPQNAAGGSAPLLPRMIASGKLTRKLYDRPSIGNAASGTLTLRTVRGIGETAYPTAFRRMQSLFPAVSIGGVSLALGEYLTDTRRSDKRTGGDEFTAYDRMILSEMEYIDQLGTYPMSMLDAVEFIAEEIGVELDESVAANICAESIDSPTNVYTCREVLRFIAAASGGNFIIGTNQKLMLIPFGGAVTGTELPCKELDYGEAQTVTGVRLLPDSSTQYFSGNETGLVIEGECAYATQAMCDAVAAKLIGTVYRPFEAQEVRLDPAAELGDSARFGGIDYMIASIDYEITAAMAATVGAEWMEDVEHQIPYQSRTRQQRLDAQSFSEIRKSTTEIALEVQGKTDKGDVNSLIKAGLEGIEISSSMSGVEGDNSCRIVLKSTSGDIVFETSGVVQMGNVTADRISASKITAGTLDSAVINLDGELNVGIVDDSGNFTSYGYVGAAYGSDAGDNQTYGAMLSSADGNSYVIVTNAGVRLQSGSNRVVVTGNNISLTTGSGQVLINGVPAGRAVFG